MQVDALANPPSGPVAVLVRSVTSLTLLAAIVLMIHWAVTTFLGEKGRTLGKLKYAYCGYDLLAFVVLALLKDQVEKPLTALGYAIARDLPGVDGAWVAALLSGIYAAATATLLLLFLIQLLGIFYWFWEARIAQLEERMLATARNRGADARVHIFKGLRLAHRLLRSTLLIVLLLFYVPYVLRSFPRSRVLVDSMLEVIGAPLSAVTKGVVDYLPNLGYLFVILLFGWLLKNAMKYVFTCLGNGTLVIGNFLPDWAEPTYKLCRFLLFAFVLMVSFPYLPGASSEFFKGFSVFIGALVTFGSSGAITNVVAGVVLTYTRAFRLGDFVRIGDTFGKVTHKSLLSTRIQTPRNEEVTFPNGSVLAGAVINYSEHARADGLAIDVSAGIGYDVDWRTIHKLMIEGAQRTPQIVDQPAPRVLEESFDNYSVLYQLRAYTKSAEDLPETIAALHRNVLDAFNQAGVEIMTPSIFAHRSGSNLAVPLEQFPKRPAPHNIPIAISPLDGDPQK